MLRTASTTNKKKWLQKTISAVLANSLFGRALRNAKKSENTNKKSLVEEGLTKARKRKDSEAKEALQSGKDAESQRRKSSRGKGPKMPRKVEPRGESSIASVRLWHKKEAIIAVKQVVFLTVNHRGPLPLRELHSTGETIVWRDPGGSTHNAKEPYKMLISLVEGITERQKWKDSETKEALQSGKGYRITKKKKLDK